MECSLVQSTCCNVSHNLYAHCMVCTYDTSCEGREMVYFHSNDNANMCGNNLLLVIIIILS